MTRMRMRCCSEGFVSRTGFSLSGLDVLFLIFLYVIFVWLVDMA